METIKKYGYTAVFIICIFVSVLLCFDMARKNRSIREDEKIEDKTESEEGKEYKFNPDGGGKTVILSEDDIVKLVEKQLSPDFPLKGIGITLKENQKAYITGTVNRKKLREYIENCGATLDSYTEMLISLFPDNISVKAEFDISTEGDGGLLILSPRKIIAAGVSVADGTLPQEFFDGLNDSINRALVGSGYLFSSISVKDGTLELLP
ncbi:MAG: hypothetical protein Q8878_01960 [Bacillota bacterium]|nr:hypothetical protein [Bacillota bacterium]